MNFTDDVPLTGYGILLRTESLSVLRGVCWDLKPRYFFRHVLLSEISHTRIAIQIVDFGLFEDGLQPTGVQQGFADEEVHPFAGVHPISGDA